MGVALARGETAMARSRNRMKILVWGLGYVGTVSAACLAQSGHEVVGIEPQRAKVNALLAGESAIKEPKLGATIADAVATGRLRATADPSGLVAGADASLICEASAPATRPDG